MQPYFVSQQLLCMQGQCRQCIAAPLLDRAGARARNFRGSCAPVAHRYVADFLLAKMSMVPNSRSLKSQSFSRARVAFAGVRN
jgi:hypothetical protein